VVPIKVLAEVMKKGFYEAGIDLTEEQIRLFQLFYELLRETNNKFNLTSILDEKEVAIKHFVDSVLCVKAIPFFDGMSLIDAGTGAGFPGIPLKICLPGLKVTLVDSQGKKVKFLTRVINETGLKNIEAIHARIEDLGRKQKFRENYDVATARALARLRVLAEYCLPLVKVGGIFLAMKGPEINEEVAEAGRAVNALGGEVIKIEVLKLPITGNVRNIILIKKEKPTPEKYPRRTGIPNKRPI